MPALLEWSGYDLTMWTRWFDTITKMFTAFADWIYVYPILRGTDALHEWQFVICLAILDLIILRNIPGRISIFKPWQAPVMYGTDR